MPTGGKVSPPFPRLEQSTNPYTYIVRAMRAHSPEDGQLNWNKPDDEPVDQYVYDPALPTASKMESFGDRREVEIRSDVLTLHQPASGRTLDDSEVI